MEHSKIIKKPCKGASKRFERYKRLKRTGRLRKNDKACHFFKIPGELRNSIYEYALLGNHADPHMITSEREDEDRDLPKRIEIKKETFAQPALLRVCKQVREEASPIHYMNHEFVFRINKYEATALIKFCTQSGFDYRTTATPTMRIEMTGFTIPNWEGVIKWLEAFHKGKAARSGCFHARAAYVCCIVQNLFATVEVLRDCDWDTQVLPVLNIAKNGLMVERSRSNTWTWPPEGMYPV